MNDYKGPSQSIPTQPRGLTNKSVWCYANSVLQALLAIPQFVGLYKDLGDKYGHLINEDSLPVTDSIISFLKKISNMSPNLMPTQHGNRRSAGSVQLPEVLIGDSFEATSIQQMLLSKKGTQFSEGFQQDAEEFLSYILNAGHDEFTECLKFVSSNSETEKDDKAALVDAVIDDGGDEWLTKGTKKGKNCITRTTEVSPSPVSKIFWGETRSVIKNGTNLTANIEPFVVFPLDIQDESITSVKEALQNSVSKVDVDDFALNDASLTTVQNERFLDHLPEVLIIQLKRFVYNVDVGMQKVLKDIDICVSLDVGKNLLSAEARRKHTSLDKTKYKLVSIVYHDGKCNGVDYNTYICFEIYFRNIYFYIPGVYKLNIIVICIFYAILMRTIKFRMRL